MITALTSQLFETVLIKCDTENKLIKTDCKNTFIFCYLRVKINHSSSPYKSYYVTKSKHNMFAKNKRHNHELFIGNLENNFCPNI